MKALSVKEPYAYLICAGIKNIENRSWRTNFRGRVLIHASGQDAIFDPTKEQNDAIIEFAKTGQLLLTLKHFAIIGSVEIVDCVFNHESIWAEKSEGISKGGHVIDENRPIIWNWVLKDPILFETPITGVKGKLSFWDYPNILAEPEEDGGKLFCHCQLPVNEKDQVISFIDHYRCRYCGGVWYK